VSRKSRPELTIIDSCEVTGGEGAEVSQAVVNCYLLIFAKRLVVPRRQGKGQDFGELVDRSSN
jgi:hypothetical protein